MDTYVNFGLYFRNAILKMLRLYPFFRLLPSPFPCSKHLNKWRLSGNIKKIKFEWFLSYFWSNYQTLLFGHKLKINISYNHCIQAWDELIVRNFSVGASSEKGNQFSVSLIKVRALTQLVSWFSIQGVLSQKFFFAKLIKKVS